MKSYFLGHGYTFTKHKNIRRFMLVKSISGWWGGGNKIRVVQVSYSGRYAEKTLTLRKLLTGGFMNQKFIFPESRKSTEKVRE